MNTTVRTWVIIVAVLAALATLSVVVVGLWSMPSAVLWILVTMVAVAGCLVNGAFSLIPGVVITGIFLPVIVRLLSELAPILPFLMLAIPLAWLWAVSTGELGPSPRPRKKDW